MIMISKNTLFFFFFKTFTRRADFFFGRKQVSYWAKGEDCNAIEGERMSRLPLPCQSCTPFLASIFIADADADADSDVDADADLCQPIRSSVVDKVKRLH